MNRSRFLWMATLFEGSLIVVAYGISWLAGGDPLSFLDFNREAIGLGLLGTLPLLLFFGVTYRLSVPQLRDIRRLLIDTLGPLLASCRWYELVYVAFLAGVSEEILFRGVLQPLFESLWGWLPGLLLSNVLFGLAHSITPLYALLAALTGAYLGWIMEIGGERNLLVPILVHSVYDLAAFAIVVTAYRAEKSA